MLKFAALSARTTGSYASALSLHCKVSWLLNANQYIFQLWSHHHIRV